MAKDGISNWNSREFDLPLDFLSDGGYTAEVYKDDRDSDQYPRNILIEERTVTNDQYLKINLSSAGGCAIRFKPE